MVCYHSPQEWHNKFGSTSYKEFIVVAITIRLWFLRIIRLLLKIHLKTSHKWVSFSCTVSRCFLPSSLLSLSLSTTMTVMVGNSKESMPLDLLNSVLEISKLIYLLYMKNIFSSPNQILESHYHDRENLLYFCWHIKIVHRCITFWSMDPSTTLYLFCAMTVLVGKF